MLKESEFRKKIGFEPHPAQLKILESQSRDKAICAGRRFGKALWVETPILTSVGWKKLLNISTGDIVYGIDGKETLVKTTTEVLYDRPCYKILFSDGSELIADEEHEWLVHSKRYRKNIIRSKGTISRPEIKTTGELSKDFSIFRPDGKIENNYAIPVCNPLEKPKKEYQIDPYILGLWLGDGTSKGNGFSSNDGEEINKELLKRGYLLEKKVGKYSWSIKFNKRYRWGKSFIGLIVLLKKLNLFGNKHIPEEYKNGSVNQRLDLLKGLMDTDGYIGENSTCEFVSVNKRLAYDTNEVILSLGIKSRMYEYDCRLYGRYIGKKYRINFTTSVPVFNLKRKLERLKTIHKSDIRSRFIKNIIAINSVPVKCIEVSKEEGIYLAGRTLIPTHNSAISAYEALRTLIDKDKEVLLKRTLPAKIWIVSPNYDLSQKVFEYLTRWYLRTFPSQTGGISYRPFPQIKTPRGSVVQCKSAENPTSLLGEEIDLLIVDEASRISKNVYETYLFPTTASRCGRTIFISTPFGKNWFYRKWVELKDTGGSFQFKTTDNPNFPEGEWERAKKILPEMVFKQEYQAEFLDDAASVFRRINEVVSDTKHDVVSEHTYVMGVDLGKHEDFTVITVIDRMNNHVVYFDRFNKIDYPFQKERILAVAKKYRNALITIDSTVVGEPIKEDLERMGAIIDDFKFSQKSKKELIEKLSIFIEQGNIHIPHEPILLDELGSFGYQLSPSGNILYAAPEGQHDDCVFSLALAVWGLTPDILHKQTKLQEEISKNYGNPINFI